MRLTEFFSNTLNTPWVLLVLLVLTTLNTFVMIGSAPLTAFFASLVAVRRDSKWYAVSFTNALGVSIGSMILIYILREYGEASMKESYPSIFESDMWGMCETFVEKGGYAGAILYSSLPILLQPLVVIVALTNKMNDITLILCIFIGRSIKYLVMGYLTVKSGKLIDSRTNASAGDKKLK